MIKQFQLPIIFCALVFCVSSQQVLAASDNPLQPRVSFTFDITTDVLINTIFPILAPQSIPGTLYAETALLNSAEDWALTWADIKALQDTHGWEIGNHSQTHANLATLSDVDLASEVVATHADFTSHGISVNSYATPFGIYDDRVLSVIAKNHTSHRMAWGETNTWPLEINDYQIRVFEPKTGISLEEAKARVDAAISNGEWLVLLFHDLTATGTVGDIHAEEEYAWPIESFTALVEYIKSLPILPLTISEGMSYGAQINLIPNPSFETLDVDGWAPEWLRTSTTTTTIDTQNHGNAPFPTHSLKMSGGETMNGILGPSIPVSTTTSYELRMFQDASSYIGGSWGVWMVELDSGGLYLGEKLIGVNESDFFGVRHYAYTPYASSTAFIRPFIATFASSSFDLFIDSVYFGSVSPALPDLLPPVITLLGSTTMDTLVGSSFTEPGYMATDNVDPSVMVVVSGTVNTSATGTYQIMYNATDVAGNHALQKVRTVNVVSAPVVNQAPTIALLGSSPVTLTVGGTYTDAGATSTDLEDGDLTSQIVATGTVNTSIAGTYTMLYTVTDSGLLSASTTRTVIVNPVPVTPPSSGGGGGGGGSSYTYTTFAINGGAAEASSSQVSLSIYASGLPQMWISNDAAFSSGSWMPIQSPYPWTLSAGTGTKTVYARFGSASTTYATNQDSIILTTSTLPPQSTTTVASTSTGIVLGASTTCTDLLTKNMRFGMRGDDVKALQSFLNTTEGESLPVTGYFGAMTRAAVSRFQAKYAAQVLTPLGLKAPTGIVGPATRAFINTLACRG